jgi:uncharacterized protein YbbC (DUF1343 family)
MNNPKVLTGLSELLAGARPELKRASTGLIAHPASVTAELVASVDALVGAGFSVSALFGPQHGMRGEKQDNMIESGPYLDPRLGLPVHSLYGDVRKPTPEMFDGLDVVLFDLQDVGVRVYTFVWTMCLAMEACREAGVRFVVLDRPNPIGGELREGPVLKSGFDSFVGLYPLPLRHGLTAGEIALLANEEFGIGCELDVVPLSEWTREKWFDDTGLPFVSPSPNLPTLDSCTVYPGMVLLEGTNLSEGRGTTRPFETFGAPYLDPYDLVETMDSTELPGVAFRPCFFEPTFQKHAESMCGGAQIHVLDRAVYRPVDTAVAILHSVKRLAPRDFDWLPPPYEYEHKKMPIDILWGSDRLRASVDSAGQPADLLKEAAQDLVAFGNLGDSYLLYD